MIYKSILSADSLSEEAVQKLAEQAALNNKKAGITGLLLLSGDRVLQVLEGPVRFVNQLYGKIVADTRHHGVELISYESVSSTFFHDWSMRILRLDRDLPAELQATLVNKYSKQNGHIAIPDDLLHVYALLLDARWGLLNSAQPD